jgi:hypothetical protein
MSTCSQESFAAGLLTSGWSHSAKKNGRSVCNTCNWHFGRNLREPWKSIGCGFYSVIRVERYLARALRR